ncbi:hypothetical protein ACWCRF_17480 [Streptomyces sp. NPDC002405]|uniref:hypothetical protein n=1 Tax=Streptomyces sp. NPDC001231 TaxID=3364549 RepID=UPI0036CA165E
MLVALEGSDPFTSRTGPDFLDSSYAPGLPLPYYRFPSSEHWLGLEPRLGRDIFARMAYGARISLTIALLSTVVSVVLGTVLGG